ncbi:hypothetical protein A2U01_0098235 [Trifolium medium]|nr:hypothetical protein [Trifolium medium]
MPLSPSVDAAEFIDDHYSFNWEDEKIQNMNCVASSWVGSLRTRRLLWPGK